MSNRHNELRDRVAMVLAGSTGLAIIMLTAAALYDALSDPAHSGISPEYASVLTGTLGVMVGSLAGYIGGRAGPVPTVDMPPTENENTLQKKAGDNRHSDETTEG